MGVRFYSSRSIVPDSLYIRFAMGINTDGGRVRRLRILSARRERDFARRLRLTLGDAKTRLAESEFFAVPGGSLQIPAPLDSPPLAKRYRRRCLRRTVVWCRSHYS